MTSGPRRAAAVLIAVAVAALVALLAGVPVPALASGAGEPTAALTSGGPDAPAAAPAAPPSGPGSAQLRLRVDALNPRVVTSTGPAVLTLTGQVVNTGSGPVRDVQVRVQRGDKLRTEGDLRTALAGDATSDAVTPEFAPVADELGPGRSAAVRLTVPLRGDPGDSLALVHSGVYELLVNVNGTPADSDPVRLTGARVLLPVLGLPAEGTRSAEPGSAAGSTPVTMLYPLADRPHRLPTGPGEPVLLDDPTLGVSISPGGRLDGLLAGLERGAPTGTPARTAVCLAVDPDLLVTVSDMAGGYRVRGPDGGQSDGRAAAAAAGWLNRLRAAASGGCVIALPFADADLVALSRAGLDDLVRYATAGGARIASDLLRTPVRADTTWPADGVLDERSLTDYTKAGGRAAVLSADAVAGTTSTGRASTAGQVRLTAPGPEATGLLADPLITLAERGSGDNRSGPLSGGVGAGGAGQRGAEPTDPRPAGTGATLSDQDGIGTIAYRALTGSDTTSTRGPAPLLVAPPHQWTTTAADAAELLSALGTLITAGMFTPTALPAAQPGPTTELSGASLVYSLRSGAREIPGSVTTRLRTDRNAAADLASAAVAEPGVGANPAQVFNPVTEGLLRAASGAWRGDSRLSDRATDVITARVARLRSLVRVLEPPSPYALGDREAPLPITLSNELPVAMRVRVVLSDTPGLRIAPIEVQQIPPMGRLQLRVNATLSRSGQFSVEARLTTATGTSLGGPSRLLLRSTAYGTITVWLTGTAGVLLVILAVRRIARRLRAGPPGRRAGPRPPGSPPPGPPTEAADAAPRSAPPPPPSPVPPTGPGVRSREVAAVAGAPHQTTVSRSVGVGRLGPDRPVIPTRTAGPRAPRPSNGSTRLGPTPPGPAQPPAAPRGVPRSPATRPTPRIPAAHDLAPPGGSAPAPPARSRRTDPTRPPPVVPPPPPPGTGDGEPKPPRR